MNQLQICFGENPQQNEPRKIFPKVPYKFFYRFTDEVGKESKLMIEDWEIGALYWKCLRDSGENEDLAIEKVRQKYYDEFIQNKDLYLFLGTNKKWHAKRGKNPFVIIGVFYPPKKNDTQMELF